MRIILLNSINVHTLMSSYVPTEDRVANVLLSDEEIIDLLGDVYHSNSIRSSLPLQVFRPKFALFDSILAV